jgi:hypothetical protein
MFFFYYLQDKHGTHFQHYSRFKVVRPFKMLGHFAIVLHYQILTQYDLRKRGVGNEGENELRAREK